MGKPLQLLVADDSFDEISERIARRVRDLLAREPVPPPMRPDEPPGLLTAEAVCERLSIGLTTLWQMRRRGTLTPVYIGRAVRFRAADVDTLLRTGAPTTP